MGRPYLWIKVEDTMILAGRKDGLGDLALSRLLLREGYGNRSPDAVRRRLQRLGSKAQHKPVKDDPFGNMDGNRVYWERMKVKDQKFHAAMRREGYRAGVSGAPGTEHPRLTNANPNAMGSCTSSAGWVV